MPETPHSLARRHGAAALEEAARLGLSAEAVARALLDLSLETFAALGRSRSDVAAELRYEADQVEEGDARYPFLRP